MTKKKQAVEPEKTAVEHFAGTYLGEALTQSQRLISEECDAIKALLLEKNRDYGDSALNPRRIFSKASPIEQILVRIDDKINRWTQGAAAGEDVEKDLIGYFVLLRVARRVQKELESSVFGATSLDFSGKSVIGSAPCSATSSSPASRPPTVRPGTPSRKA